MQHFQFHIPTPPHRPTPRLNTFHLRSQGFTFIEVMLVVLVLSIMAAMALPMFKQTDATKLRNAAQVLAADLNYTQMQSIAHGDDPRVIVFDIPNNQYWIAASSSANSPINHPVSKKPYLVEFGQGSLPHLDGVTLDQTTVGVDNKLKFEMYGQLDQATAATITLQCSGILITVTVDPLTGETSISDIN